MNRERPEKYVPFPDEVTVTEMTEEEFWTIARTFMPSVRVVELNGRRVVIGGCGPLKGYVLKDYTGPVFK